ncbi:MAG: SDR family oxidoreductase [Deltaproteobacteria bacterium]|nr:SDR family oxidoreductase [Deltaproteobacteria bacterium]
MKNVLLTGASRGIGLALGRAMTGSGWKVWGTCRRDADLVSEAGVTPIHLDIQSGQNFDGIRDNILEYTESLDLIIHNAALSSTNDVVPASQSNLTFGTLDSEGLINYLSVNALAPLMLTQSLLPLLRKGESPTVMCVSTRKAAITNVVSGGNYGYRGSKSLFNMWMRLMAVDLKEEGILVYGVHPGHVRTRMGGEKAPLSPEESAQGLMGLLKTTTMEKSGAFLRLDGTAHAW